MDLLGQLSELSGVSGREEEIRDFILKQVQSHVDAYEIDPMGNLICRKYAQDSDKWVMIACHMDEIGFYVRYIDKEGFLRLQAVGGFDPRQLFSRRVTVHTQKGKRVGIMYPSGPPLHVAKPEDLKKIPEIKDFFVDLGLPAEQVQKRVQLGDPVTLWQPFMQIGDLVSGKALDDRAACWVGIRLLQSLTQPEHNVAVVFTVQEEVGLRGATTSAYTINPTYSIAVDVTLAADTPRTDKEEYISELGKGACIGLMNGSVISDRELVNTFVDLAKKHKIPYQMEILPRGGTDAGMLQRARGGSKAITISVPTRYIHTVCETIHPKDLQATSQLLLAFCQKIPPKTTASKKKSPPKSKSKK
jgi:endoglucanase